MTPSCTGIWLKCSCDSKAQLDSSLQPWGGWRASNALLCSSCPRLEGENSLNLPHGSCCREAQPDTPFSLGASELPGSSSSKFSAIAVGNVNAVGFVKLIYVLHYSDWTRPSVVIHQWHRKTRTDCSMLIDKAPYCWAASRVTDAPQTTGQNLAEV